MKEERDNIYDHPTATTGGGGNDVRLRRVEDRLTRLETKLDTALPYLATKEDIQKIKVWILAGVLGGIALAVTVAFAFLKMFGGL